jgi:hypothetical protein
VLSYRVDAIETRFRADLSGPAMGERACYREFCPVCDGPVTVVDETCPDCGAVLDGE